MMPERVLRDLVVERWPIDRLIPYVRNARTHTEEQVAQSPPASSEFGWTNPILVGADGVIIAGHARLLAARKLGMTKVRSSFSTTSPKRSAARWCSPTTAGAERRMGRGDVARRAGFAQSGFL